MGVILLSGGVDSAVCLARYGADLAVGYDYGQLHAIELHYASKLADRFRVRFETVRLPVLRLVNDVVFAGRNALFIAHAASVAISYGLDEVMIGCNATDALLFPDCRAPFLDAMSTAMLCAYGVRVSAPLLRERKDDIVAEAIARDLSTWSCYRPGPAPCGECVACKSAMPSSRS